MCSLANCVSSSVSFVNLSFGWSALQVLYIHLAINSLCLNVSQIFFQGLFGPFIILYDIFSHINKFSMLIWSDFPFTRSVWVMF